MLSAILISRLVLRMRRMYVASIRLHFHEESWMSGMHRTQFDHVRLGLLSLVIWSLLFDYFSRETYTKHSDGAKAFWPSIVVARTS